MTGKFRFGRLGQPRKIIHLELQLGCVWVHTYVLHEADGDVNDDTPNCILRGMLTGYLDYAWLIQAEAERYHADAYL